jgi:uncharacterized membrane protein YdjX (TVP38/TMEM64 family)
MLFWTGTIAAVIAATLVYHFGSAALRRRRIKARRDAIDARKQFDMTNWSY